MLWPWYLAAIGVLFVLSAVFSGSETALFSLSHASREWLQKEKPSAGRRVSQLLAEPERLLGTILLGNLLVNISASAFFTLAIIDWAGRANRNPDLYLGFGGLVMTGLVLVFGEVSPKIIASRRPDAFAAFAVDFMAVVRLVLSPFSLLLVRLGQLVSLRKPEPDVLSEDELHTMIRLGRERGVIVEREAEILHNLVGLEQRTVSSVMTPRIDIVWLDAGAPVRQAIEVCRMSGFSRLPVADRTIDRVVGVAYAKELVASSDLTAPVKAVCRPAYFVPETKRLPVLLEELRKKGSHIAIVVDEFGQTAGLVTLEDVLEAIFGEITDEFDEAEELPYSHLDENTVLVDGEIDIATLERFFPGAFRGVEHDRLASFIHERLGRLARPGDRIVVADLELTVHSVVENKLEKVLIRRVGGGHT
ncbi:MAG: hemolysin family protein [candidate division WOR-3 bacterium]